MSSIWFEVVRRRNTGKESGTATLEKLVNKVWWVVTHDCKYEKDKEYVDSGWTCTIKGLPHCCVQGPKFVVWLERPCFR